MPSTTTPLDKLKSQYENEGYQVELRTHQTAIKSGTDYPYEIWFRRKYRCGWVARGEKLNNRLINKAKREIKVLIANGSLPLK